MIIMLYLDNFKDYIYKIYCSKLVKISDTLEKFTFILTILSFILNLKVKKSTSKKVRIDNK